MAKGKYWDVLFEVHRESARYGNRVPDYFVKLVLPGTSNAEIKRTVIARSMPEAVNEAKALIRALY